MTNGSPRLLLPGLAPLYRTLAPFTELLIRLVAGLSLVPHGYPKLLNPADAGQFLEESGFRPGIMWAVLLGVTEVFGGLLLAAGFLTRLVCIPILIFLATAIVFHSQFGFLWNNRGFEYPLFWTVVVLHFFVHGGGRHSLDARIGREF